MIPRAIILDVYGTLLEIGPPRAAAELDTLWESLHSRFLRTPPGQPFDWFSHACRTVIEQEHARARALGVLNPEVDWPAIVVGLVPGVRQLPPPEQRSFLVELAGLPRSLRLAKGAGETLARLLQLGAVLGIASNAQHYTHTELATALEPTGLNLSIFEPSLCFWSFENGFSKPNPRVFQILSARLRALGIHPSETLMVGDRLDNDVEPARRSGWRAWHLHPEGDGLWRELAARLESDSTAHLG